MVSLSELTETLPVRPGESPFRARGLFYDQVLRQAAALPGGTPNFLAQIKDERVREFMGQRFKWNDWYDALPMTPVQAALCRAEGVDFETAVRRRSRVAAESLVPRLFRVVIGMGSPKLAAEHLPRILVQNYDFAQVRFDVTGNQGVGIISDVPKIIAPGFVNMVMGLAEGGLRLMGAKTVEHRFTKIAAGTPQHGYETLCVEALTVWTK